MEKKMKIRPNADNDLKFMSGMYDMFGGTDPAHQTITEKTKDKKADKGEKKLEYFTE